MQTVTVRDKSGMPVPGLTAKDFVVTEEGERQDLAFVEYQALDLAPLASHVLTIARADAASTTSLVPSTTPGVVSIPGSATFRGRRLLILYFDLYQMPLFDRLRAFENADTYVTKRMAAADLIAVMVFDGAAVRLKQNFTDDRSTLRTALDGLMQDANDESNGAGIRFDPGSAFGEDDDTFNMFSTDRQLAALQTAVSDLGPLPELKTLVYFGSLRLQGTDNQAQLRATENAAVRANVTINPIDARGLVAAPLMGDATRPSPGGIGMFSGEIASAALARGQQQQDALYALAKDTGGRAMFDNNDLSLGIAQAANAVTGYYILGYYTTHVAKDGKYRHVTVTLSPGHDATAAFRSGYYGEKEFAKFTTADRERQLADALRLDDPITEIPMAMEVNYFQLNRAEYYVPVSVRMPGSELTRPAPGGRARSQVDIIGEIKDSHGVTIQNARDTLQFTVDAAKAGDIARRPIQYETGFTLLPGSYLIKMLARDDTTGRIGTYQTEFVVPNLEREVAALPLSSVVLSNQRVPASDTLFAVKQKINTDAVNPLIAGGQRLIPSVARSFSVNRPLFVLAQAYEPDAAAIQPLVAFVTFYRDGVEVLETEPAAIHDTWNGNARAVPIRLTVGLRSLEPGLYDCQLTVLDPAGKRAAFWREEITLAR